MNETPHQPERDRDPTRMANQPALRTSSGAVWLIIGGLFVVMSLIPLSALAFVRQGPSASLALVLASGIVVLYLVMIIVRVVVRQRVLRLRLMAACLIAMAATGVIGLLASMVIERSAVAS